MSVASVLLKKKTNTVITDPEETRLTLQNALKVTDPLKTESVRANWHLQNVKTASFCFFEGGFIEKKKANLYFLKPKRMLSKCLF